MSKKQIVIESLISYFSNVWNVIIFITFIILFSFLIYLYIKDKRPIYDSIFLPFLLNIGSIPYWILYVFIGRYVNNYFIIFLIIPLVFLLSLDILLYLKIFHKQIINKNIGQYIFIASTLISLVGFAIIRNQKSEII